jgi:hypothetical protein
MEVIIKPIDSDVPEDIVQFIKHLEENISSDYESCTMTVRAVDRKQVDTLPGENITLQTEPEKTSDMGVHIEIVSTDESEDPPISIPDSLIQSYFKPDGFTSYGSYDGTNQTREIYVFPFDKHSV